jgi:hypothetical protein
MREYVMAEYESNRSHGEDRPRTDERASGREASHDAGRRPDPDAVARRAYQRYEERGREDGHDLEDWLTAERDLTAS